MKFFLFSSVFTELKTIVKVIQYLSLSCTGGRAVKVYVRLQKRFRQFLNYKKTKILKMLSQEKSNIVSFWNFL